MLIGDKYQSQRTGDYFEKLIAVKSRAGCCPWSRREYEGSPSGVIDQFKHTEQPNGTPGKKPAVP